MFEAASTVNLPAKDILSYIFDNPTYDQNKPIYIDAHNPDRRISCNEARQIVRQLIAGFRAAGVRPGDCVALHSFNDIYYCMIVLAIIGVGGIFTGTNPSYTEAELSHHIKTAGATFLLSEPEISSPLLDAAKKNDISEENFWIFDKLEQQVPPGKRSWKSLLDHGEDDWVRFSDIKLAQSTTAARLFSSGTTGLPKAVTITHYNLIAQHELVFKADPRPYQVSRVVPIPIFHAAAAPSTHIGALASGHIIYMMRRFELESFLKTVEAFQATELMLVPPIVIAILMSPYSKTRDFLASVRFATSGAAPLDKELQVKFMHMLGDGACMNQVWGMTETSCIATKLRHNESDESGSVGRPIPNLEIKIVDDKGQDVSDYDVRGEICVRGPTVTPGYFQNAAANSESFDSDGWYKTGDIGYCAEKSRMWYLVDRKKELIKVRGFQVAPPELEAVLLSHPQIVDAGVIGVTLPGANGESPRAYIVRRPGEEGSKLQEKEVQDYLTTRLARYKALTGGVKFIDALPKNASGKILKRLLREDSKKDIEAGAVMAKI